MREIKFRAKAGLRWCYGEFYHSERNEPVIYEPQSRGKTLEGIPYDGWRLKVDPETVGQYTGLKDADGREVYEGDILVNPNYVQDVRVIEWRDYQWSMVSHTHPFQATVPMIWIGGYKVCGNVYDNPELLERKP